MPQPRPLDVVRDRIRVRHYSYQTETVYLGWIRRFVRFHRGRHPRQLGGPEVEQFLSHLAVDRNVSASTQNQALSAILFLYKEVLELALPWLDGIVRAERPARVPLVLSRDEVRRLLAHMEGAAWLAAGLLYGTVQELLGRADVSTTMIYTHVIKRGGRGVKSPID